jgi:hypothetical protein
MDMPSNLHALHVRGLLALDLGTPRVEISWGARNVLSVSIAKAANPADSRQALLEGDESAVRATSTVIRTPWIILGLGAVADPARDYENS